ncbi:MAG: IS1096 element passenger TnpR family protein [Janthinobacterium lividum]
MFNQASCGTFHSRSHPRSAVCIDGARARPPEDVSDVPGYEDFLTVMSDPEEPVQRDIKRWCGGHFDPEWFDLPRSCPSAWCRSAGCGSPGRGWSARQPAKGGRLTVGVSLNGASVSRLM